LQLYLDDGISFDYARKSAFRLRRFDYAPQEAGATTHFLKSSSASTASAKAYAPANTVERVVIMGAGKAPRAATAADADGVERKLTYVYDAGADMITLRRPDVKVAYDWTVTLQF
jgi:hypothetical protein